MKFRAWDDREEKMYYSVFRFPGLWTDEGILMEEDCYIYSIDHKNEQVTILSDASIILEFTGLKDRNGTEIYVDDILLYEYVIAGKTIQYYLPVKWYQTKAQYLVDGKIPSNGTHRQLYNWNGKCEVIGNIYENQELLK